MKNLTPMMKQYFEIKEKHKDCILFFRLGDFYEMFFDDAITASRELEITLTGRDCGQEERAPMCGVPHHSAENYIAKLINKGYKVAICEQTEDPSQSKGIVKREVIKIVTPGTVISPNMLREKDNNYLLSIYADDEGAGLAFADISTGELKATLISGKKYLSKLLNEIVKIRPSEIIMNDYLNYEDERGLEDLSYVTDAFVNTIKDYYFKEDFSAECIKSHFKVKTLKGLGLDENVYTVRAVGALLGYLYETQNSTLLHMNRISLYDLSNHMSLDKATLKNLELVETASDKRTEGSLLNVLDKTNTAMGGRKLKQWLKEPLNTLEGIRLRLDAVEALYENSMIRNNLKESLKKVYDLERLSGRIACRTANGRDLIALKNSLQVLPDIRSDLEILETSLLKQLFNTIDPLKAICGLISEAIVDDPPYTIKEGGLIKEGYNSDLDDLKSSISKGQQWIANLENTERTNTGIKSLKVGFNKVFGYYIEVTKSYYHLVPENYIRKQTLANCERFITPELKDVESKVLNAEVKINQLEYEIFSDIRDKIEACIETIQRTADSIANLDVLVSFGDVSEKLNYIKPKVNSSGIINIVKGRHPVVELSIKNGMFISNDTYIGSDLNSFLLITGPNMSGKSTYMRQTAIIVLMAQIGCFVPAEDAQIGIVDRIFTRIGASDNLSQGQSTFIVEMSELAYILNNATEKSLVILDEIGRGTSTYDGLSIAWAVVEYMCSHLKKIKALFATHYHELTQLEGSIRGVKNLNVDVKEKDNEIIFLHKIMEGCASQSYGIQVARLAGVPEELLLNAAKKLTELENQSERTHSISNIRKEFEEQISLFDIKNKKLIDRLKSIDIVNITPVQALNILEELIHEAEEVGD